MMKCLGWLLLGGLLVVGYNYLRENPKQKLLAILKHLPQSDTAKSETGQSEAHATDSDAKTTVAGALASWIHKEEPSVPEPSPRKPNSLDHIAPSPVGSTNRILHKTFAVNTLTKFSFEIPSHAATPRLHGAFRSFWQEAAESGDDSGTVDFLVLNEQQYADLAAGRQSEALFSAEATHDQEVNLGLPVSQDQPQKYYLVFRNSSATEGKKLVEANFAVNF